MNKLSSRRTESTYSSLGMRWFLFGVQALMGVMFAVVAVRAQRDGPLAVALAGLAVLYVGAFLLARGNRRSNAYGSGALLTSLRSCPSWFGYAVLGVAVGLVAFYTYVVVGSLNDRAGDSPHAVETLAPLMVFLFGCVGLLQVLPRLSFGRR